jgi:hypothetical protein
MTQKKSGASELLTLRNPQFVVHNPIIASRDCRQVASRYACGLEVPL